MLKINGQEFKSYQTCLAVFPYDHDTLDAYYQLLDDARSAVDTLKELFPLNDKLCEKLDGIAEWCDSEQSLILLDSECECSETFSAYDEDTCYVCHIVNENNSTEVPTDV